jgi:WD40 repeat protein
MADPTLSGNDATVIQAEENLAQAQVLSLAAPLGGPPQLPGYQLTERLGQGSFGEVWSGVQVRTGQTVAVKIITASVGMNWRYLEHEVARLRQVAEHPHVVTLLDADLQNSPPYFVMTLHGRSLQGWSAPGQPQGVACVLAWFGQMARALQFTHGRGLLHCDLKPSNVLLDEEGMARLSDFGQSVGRGQPAHSLGSLGYMGPEQASREAAPDVSWDVYGLGATVYALLTGQTPRLDEKSRLELATLSDSNTKLQRYLELLQSRPLIPLVSLNPEVDEDLAAIVESMLILEPARRTGHMAQVLEDLDRRKFGLPLLCRQPWSAGYRIRRLWRRHRQALILTSLALLGLVYLGLGKVQSDRTARALLARQQWEKGWTLQSQGREGEALLWWAREGAADRDHALVLGQASSHLLGLEKWSDPPTFLAFAEDGRLLVGCESRIQLGEQNWESKQHSDDCHDMGPYRIPRASVGWLRPGQAIGRLDGQVQLLTPQQRPLGPCVGPVVVHDGLALYSDGQQLRVYSDHPQVLQDSEGELMVGAVGSGWAARAQAGEISVWNVKTGARLPLVLTHEQEVNALCLSPDGTRLASAGNDNRVRLWQLPSGTLLGQVQGKMMMESCKFSPDGSLLATCNYDGTVELRSGRDLSSLGLAPLKHRWMVYGVSFSASGKLLVTRSIDGTARCWDATTGLPVSPFLEHGSPVRLAAFRADEKELATAALDGTVRRFSLHPEPRLKRLQEAEEKANWGEFSSDGRRAALALGSQVQLWDLEQGRLLRSLSLEGGVNVLRFSADGRTLVTAGRQICRWDSQTLDSVGQPVDPQSEVTAALFSPDGRWLVTGSQGGQVQLWDGDTGQPGFVWEGHQTPITSLELSPDARTLVSCGANGEDQGEACLREFPSGRLLATLQHDRLGIRKAIFSPDGSRLLTCGEDASARWWDGRSGKALNIPRLQHSLGIWDAAWSPKGDSVVTASGDSTLQVWDLDGRAVTPALQHNGPVVKVEISGDGERIASSSKDGTARLWDAQSGQPLLPPVRHQDMVFVCRFAPNDQLLLTAANDGSVYLLDLYNQPMSPESLRRRVESWTGLRLSLTGGVPRVRALTPEEWSFLQPGRGRATPLP